MPRHAGMLRYATLAFLLGTLALAACGGDGATQNAGETPPDTQTPSVAPEEALRLFVQRRLNQSFVANCDNAERPGDVGKQCARYRGERDGFLAYELGPVFAEYTRLIILERAGDSWTIAHLENHDPAQPPAPGIPWPLRPGAQVVVAGTDDCLRVRAQPRVSAPEIACLDDGAFVTIASGPQDADGFEWWELEGYDGWVAGNWLRYQEEAPAGTPNASPEG